MKTFAASLLALYCSLGIAAADRVVYRIKTQTEDTTYNDVKIVMWGEKGGTTSTGWMSLKGSRSGLEDYEYVCEDLGPIHRIGIKVMNQVVFGIPDSWTATWVEVQYPWPQGQTGNATSKFVLGKPLDGGAKAVYFNATSIANRPPITVSPTGQIQRSEKIIKVAHFMNNPTSGTITAMQSKESWGRSDSVAISQAVTSGSSAAVSLSYQSPDTVVGTFGATAEKAWSEALTRSEERAEQQVYSKEQDWTYTVEPRTAKFRQLVLRVPTEYALYAAENGQKRWIRQPGGPATDTGTGEQLEIPQTDRNGKVIPVAWSYIDREFWPYLDDQNRAKALSLRNYWIQQGWVYLQNPPVATAPVQQPQSPALAPLTLIDVLGTYRYEPASNDWHYGQIQRSPNGQGLRWLNAAGVSWELQPDLQAGILRKLPGSVYYDAPGGQQFDILRGGSGEVTGFRFQNDVYRRL